MVMTGGKEINFQQGENCHVGAKVKIGDNVSIGHNCILEDYVEIGAGTYIDSNCIIRSNTRIGADSFIGSNCIIGEYGMDYYMDKKRHDHSLTIGAKALIRSGTILYTGSEVGENLQTGHHVTIREMARIGNHVSVGTLSDIQGDCEIGDYVRIHSNVHIGKMSVIDDFAWIFPYVVLTNDPTPPSRHLKGVHICPFAVIAAAAVILPGIEIGQDSLVAAGAVVTKPVAPYAVVSGDPAVAINDVRKIRDKITNEPVYPWREHFGAYMPWSESDFGVWYASLSLEEKQNHKIEKLGG